MIDNGNNEGDNDFIGDEVDIVKEKDNINHEDSNHDFRKHSPEKVSKCFNKID